QDSLVKVYSQSERPNVEASRVLWQAGSSRMVNTGAVGRLVPSVDAEIEPPGPGSGLMKTPRSVATIRLPLCTRVQFAATSGRLPLMVVRVAPASSETKSWPTPTWRRAAP